MATIDELKGLKTLAKRIKGWREYRKMSRKTLSTKAGVAYSTLADLENDRQKSTTAVTAIAGALEINAHHLATGEGNPLDINAPPPKRELTNELVQYVSPDDIASMSPTEFALAQLKIRDAVREVLNMRSKNRARKVG